MPIEEENQGNLHSRGIDNSMPYATVLTKIMLICLLPHKRVQRDMNCLDMPQEIIWVHCTYHVILLRSGKQKNGQDSAFTITCAPKVEGNRDKT